MLRIALVSYLNTKPFVEGLLNEFGADEIKLNLLPPSGCADALKNGECDLALVPSGALPGFSHYDILSKFCIGANGPVDSVFLFSKVPVAEVTHVITDPDSRTSNLLAQILFQKKWDSSPLFVTGSDREFSDLHSTTARVAIGDVAHKLKNTIPYAYDLSAEWKEFTGMPFVFAVWISLAGKISQENISRLNRAFRKGMSLLHICAQKYAEEFDYSIEEAKTYLTRSLDYYFNEEKKIALSSFLIMAEEFITDPGLLLSPETRKI